MEIRRETANGPGKQSHGNISRQIGRIKGVERFSIQSKTEKKLDDDAEDHGLRSHVDCTNQNLRGPKCAWTMKSVFSERIRDAPALVKLTADVLAGVGSERRHLVHIGQDTQRPRVEAEMQAKALIISARYSLPLSIRYTSHKLIAGNGIPRVLTSNISSSSSSTPPSNPCLLHPHGRCPRVFDVQRKAQSLTDSKGKMVDVRL